MPASKGPISSFASDMEASMKSDEDEAPEEMVRIKTWIVIILILAFLLTETTVDLIRWWEWERCWDNIILNPSLKSNFQPKLPILSDVDQELIKDAKISFQVPNPGFIFHNKLPKSGSTTMHNILTVLSQWNNFEHIKIDSAMMSFDDEGLF